MIWVDSDWFRCIHTSYKLTKVFWYYINDYLHAKNIYIAKHLYVVISQDGTMSIWVNQQSWIVSPSMICWFIRLGQCPLLYSRIGNGLQKSWYVHPYHFNTGVCRWYSEYPPYSYIQNSENIGYSYIYSTLFATVNHALYGRNLSSTDSAVVITW